MFVIEPKSHFKASTEKSSISLNSKEFVWKTKYKKIKETISIKTAPVIKILFALKYFWRAQIGLSTKNETRFHNPRNNHISIKFSSFIVKKKTNVK
ncbi:MAG: hypothetical protein LBC61_05125 [Candidatus Peribacteria bacterium]|jgi:hypothetical protein|nr:hypothetical protein [Candidatus Peribacteria bacterium]